MEEIYGFLDKNLFLPQEQKGRRRKSWRKSRWKDDPLFIDQMIVREVKMKKQNLSVGWIDYKQTYDMMPHL